MLGRCDCVDDDQLAAATWAWQREGAGRLIGVAEIAVTGVILFYRLGPEQVSDAGDIGHAVSIAEEPVVTDAVLALWQNMDQEPANEL